MGTDSYQDLSEISGIPYTSIVKCFRDPANCGVGTMIRVCKALRIPMDEAKAYYLKVCADRTRNLKRVKWETAIKK